MHCSQQFDLAQVRSPDAWDSRRYQSLSELDQLGGDESGRLECVQNARIGASLEETGPRMLLAGGCVLAMVPSKYALE